MARPPKRESKPANLECLNCGHHFVAVVPHVGQYVAEVPQPVRWGVSATGHAACPSCGSELVEEKTG